MKRVYRIASEKYYDLKRWYKYYGCNEAEAETYAATVFNHSVESDQNMTFTPGWEIEFQMPLTKNMMVVNTSANARVLGHWMKGGWNRIGTWENEPYHQENGSEHTTKVFPAYGWPDTKGLSCNYLTYVDRCGRKADLKDVNPQDFLDGINQESAVGMKKLPVNVAAFLFDGMLCISAEAVKADIRKEEPVDHVFVVDVSGSMSCRWALVQLTMVALFNVVPASDRVSIIAFSDTCQIIEEGIHGGDHNRFKAALSRICASGGFVGKLPILQTAYGILNRGNRPGIVTVFTDGALTSGFQSYEICNAFIREQANMGNQLHMFSYGSDSWCKAELIQMVLCGNGRLQLILEPQNIKKPLQEHWMEQGDTVKNFKISIKGDREYPLFGGDSESAGVLQCFTLTEGTKTCALFSKCDIVPGENIELSVKWETDRGNEQEENIRLKVQQASAQAMEAVKKAIEVQRRKDSSGHI